MPGSAATPAEASAIAQDLLAGFSRAEVLVVAEAAMLALDAGELAVAVAGHVARRFEIPAFIGGMLDQVDGRTAVEALAGAAVLLGIVGDLADELREAV